MAYPLESPTGYVYSSFETADPHSAQRSNLIIIVHVKNMRGEWLSAPRDGPHYSSGKLYVLHANNVTGTRQAFIMVDRNIGITTGKMTLAVCVDNCPDVPSSASSFALAA